MEIKMSRETWENLVWGTETATLWVRKKINDVDADWAMRSLKRETKHGKEPSKRACHWAARTARTNHKLNKARHAMEPRTRAQFQWALNDVSKSISFELEMIGARMYRVFRDSLPEDDLTIKLAMDEADRLFEKHNKYERELLRLKGELLCGACGAPNKIHNLYCSNCGQPLEKE